ncbi:uncharacterized protein LOC143208231 [Lasioglossum baleicum]|uniref:uncharacterized protein LOC143208231 n=1 Tax=Lasioglossum baleicum TaxID=434251 RepID=UPI003FCC77B5
MHEGTGEQQAVPPSVVDPTSLGGDARVRLLRLFRRRRRRPPLNRDRPHRRRAVSRDRSVATSRRHRQRRYRRLLSDQRENSCESSKKKIGVVAQSAVAAWLRSSMLIGFGNRHRLLSAWPSLSSVEAIGRSTIPPLNR